MLLSLCHHQPAKKEASKKLAMADTVADGAAHTSGMKRGSSTR